MAFPTTISCGCAWIMAQPTLPSSARAIKDEASLKIRLKTD
jgi:hypothetical protein